MYFDFRKNDVLFYLYSIDIEGILIWREICIKAVVVNAFSYITDREWILKGGLYLGGVNPSYT